MDRQSRPSGKITIKINSEQEDIRKRIKVYDWQDARKELSATKDYQKERNRVFPWQKPAYIKLNHKKRPLRSRKRSFSVLKNSRKEPLSAWIMAIISAIIVGVLIGLLLLNVMVKDGKEQEVSGEVTAPVTTTPEKGEQVLLPETEFVFLQQGVYENEKSFKELIDQSKLPLTYVQVDGRYHVLAGVAPSLDEAKAIRESMYYREMFPKALTTNEKVLNSITANEKQFLERSLPFYQSMLQICTKIFLERDPKDEEFAGLANDYQELTKFVLETTQLQELQTSLQNAYQALKKYMESKSDDDWFLIQKHLLQFATDFYRL